MPSIGSTTGPKTDRLGPYSKVTPTNRAGETNADDAPTITAGTRDGQVTQARSRDVDIQVLAALRVLCRIVAEQTPGTWDDIDGLIADEEIILGYDTRS